MKAIVHFPQSSYSKVHFEGARFFEGCRFEHENRIIVLLGFKAEAEVSSTRSTVTLIYARF